MIDKNRLEAIMAYCRIDPTEMEKAEMDLLEAMAVAAEGYLAGAGILPPLAEGVEPTEERKRRQAMYDLVVNALTLDAWDLRDATILGHIVAENPSLRRMITQLKLSGGGLV